MGKDLVRRDPFDVFAPFMHFGRQWNDVVRSAHSDEQEARRLIPAMDVTETDNELVLSAELPGLGKDTVKVTIEDGILTISGEKAAAKTEDDGNTHVSERRYGAFHRQVTLPTHVDAGKAAADFEHGVLTIRIPRAEAAMPREILIS